MITSAASILFLCLLVVAIAYFLWAIGSKYPIRDPHLVARTIDGRPGVERLSRLSAFGVAVFALIAAVIGTALGDLDSGGMALTIAGAVVGLLFAVRGILGYTPAWRASHPVEPFASLDRRYYSPLCLVVAACFAILVITRLT